MSDKLQQREIGSQRNVIIPEPSVLPDGMFECPKCKQTFPERDLYKDHYIRAHT